jgi:hypothetical protein
VRLEKASVGLRLHHRQLDLLRASAEIDPGGDLGHLEVGIRTEEHLGYDLLGPGGTGLGVAGDDDVVVAKAEVVPAGRIEVVVV